MEEKHLLTIQKFAELCRTTPRAIRFYEEKGLIKPAQIGKWNKYRLYSPDQTREVLKIRLFQLFDVNLKDMKAKLDTVSTDFLDVQLNGLKEEIEQKKKQYSTLKNLNQFLFGHKSPEEFLKEESIGPYLLFCRSFSSGQYDQINSEIRNLYQVAKQLHLSVTPSQIIIYPEPDKYSPHNIKFEIGIILKVKTIPRKTKLLNACYFKEFPKIRSFTYQYRGPYEYITFIYQKFFESNLRSKLYSKRYTFDLQLDTFINKKSQFDYLTKIAFPKV